MADHRLDGDESVWIDQIEALTGERLPGAPPRQLPHCPR